MGGKRKIRLSYNSPVVLSFALACVAVQVLSLLTGGGSNRLLFSVYRASLLDPLTWIRLVGHVLGHSGWEHLLNNMMFILILGPMIEEKYGTSNTLFIMLATAVVTGILNTLLFPGVRLLGASGIVFAFILLASITSVEEKTIPLTFVLVALLYIGREVYNAVAVRDSISQMAHIVGGLVGSGLGFLLNRGRTGSAFGR
ncbi:MAG: rhomboid family intramembrane serine protease [Clostridia bacterium]|nr:rhomboid family intramembrane serine protease [Clostridia bacterium]